MSDAAQELTSIIREFQAGYRATGAAKLPPTFKQAADRFLCEHVGEPHAFADFFNGIATVSESLAHNGRFHDALSLWQTVHRVIAQWEGANENKPGFRPVHLGTPYYFSSGTHFRMGNREHALMLMHLAFEQDDRNMPGEDTPARKFIGLDANSPNQYLRAIVVSLSEFLNFRLDWYRTFAEPPDSHTYGTLTWDEFRTRFLIAGGDLASTAAFFVFSVAKVHALWVMAEAFQASRFTSRIFENALLNMCIVFEELVRLKHVAVHGPGQPTMRPLIVFLGQQTGLNFTDANLKAIQKARNHDFDKTVKQLVTGRYPGTNWRIDEDVMTMYALRDPAAHQIRPLMTAVTRFQSLSDSIMRSIFFVVERLYA